jgi:hypothetical protein
MDKPLRKAIVELANCQTRLLWLSLLFPAAIATAQAFDEHAERDSRVIAGAIALFFLATLVFQRVQRARAIRFVRWLWDQQKAIDGGQASYRGQPITSATRLKQYEVMISYVILRARMQTAPLVVGSRGATVARMGSTVVTGLLGWWSLSGVRDPAGVMRRNLSDSNEVTVGEILEALRQQATPARPNTASATG